MVVLQGGHMFFYQVGYDMWYVLQNKDERGPVEDKGHGCVINDAALQCVFISIIFV